MTDALRRYLTFALEGRSLFCHVQNRPHETTKYLISPLIIHGPSNTEDSLRNFLFVGNSTSSRNFTGTSRPRRYRRVLALSWAWSQSAPNSTRTNSADCFNSTKRLRIFSWSAS